MLCLLSFFLNPLALFQGIGCAKKARPRKRQKICAASQIDSQRRVECVVRVLGVRECACALSGQHRPRPLLRLTDGTANGDAMAAASRRNGTERRHDYAVGKWSRDEGAKCGATRPGCTRSHSRRLNDAHSDRWLSQSPPPARPPSVGMIPALRAAARAAAPRVSTMSKVREEVETRQTSDH